MKDSPTRARIPFRTRNEDASGACPIIYVHGAASNKSIWLMLSRELASALPERVGYSIDLPGHGDAEKPGCERIEDYAEAVLGFMDDLRVEKAVLIGHSMGGAIVQQIAIDEPEKVDRLVFLATGARLGVNDMILEAFRSDFHAAMSMMKEIIFAPSAPEACYGPALEQMKSTSLETVLADFTACNGFDSVGRIEKVAIPAIVCCGDRDMLTPARKNRRLADSLGCETFELPETGHMIQVERPAELAKIISDFLA